MSNIDRLNAALAGRYRVDRELGRGGMAVVYLAHDRDLDRDVALKVLLPELAASLGGQRFLREIEIAAKLSHPNILTLHDRGEVDGLLYYTMPYVEGESLRDRLDREKQLPIDEALAIAAEVAGALSHAHEQGVVHRDIKPENILLQGGHALVSDFGIARAVREAGGERLTQTGITVGTVSYMSPRATMRRPGPTLTSWRLGRRTGKGTPPYRSTALRLSTWPRAFEPMCCGGKASRKKRSPRSNGRGGNSTTMRPGLAGWPEA